MGIFRRLVLGTFGTGPERRTVGRLVAANVAVTVGVVALSEALAATATRRRLLAGEPVDDAVVTARDIQAKHMTWSVVNLEELRLHTLLTHQFVHGNLSHLASNMAALCVFGPTAAAAIGSTRLFYGVYLAGGAAGALAWTAEQVAAFQRDGTSEKYMRRVAGVGYADMGNGVRLTIPVTHGQLVDRAEELAIGASASVACVAAVAAAVHPLGRLLYFRNATVVGVAVATDVLALLSRKNEEFDAPVRVGSMAHVGGALAGLAFVALAGRAGLVRRLAGSSLNGSRAFFGGGAGAGDVLRSAASGGGAGGAAPYLARARGALGQFRAGGWPKK